jgi:alkylation response protein AidB-like acyl-CoA dehydrogenase
LAPYKLTFNDMRLLPDRLVGGENKGWESMLSGLQAERPLWGGNAFLVHIWQF